MVDQRVPPGKPQADLPAHHRSAEDLAQSLGADLDAGLSDEQAAGILERVGPNQLDEEPPIPAWKKPVFETATSLRSEWLLIAALSPAPMTVIEVEKLASHAWRSARRSRANG